MTAMTTAVVISALVAALLPGAEDTVSTEEPRTVRFEEMEYPLAARLTGVEGVVVIEATLDEAGHVADVRGIAGHKELIKACLANVKLWRFQLNKQRKAVVVYRFVRRGVCKLPCKSSFAFFPPNYVEVQIGNAAIDHSAETDK